MTGFNFMDALKGKLTPDTPEEKKSTDYSWKPAEMMEEEDKVEF